MWCIRIHDDPEAMHPKNSYIVIIIKCVFRLVRLHNHHYYHQRFNALTLITMALTISDGSNSVTLFPFMLFSAYELALPTLFSISFITFIWKRSVRCLTRLWKSCVYSYSYTKPLLACYIVSNFQLFSVLFIFNVNTMRLETKQNRWCAMDSTHTHVQIDVAASICKEKNRIKISDACFVILFFFSSFRTIYTFHFFSCQKNNETKWNRRSLWLLVMETSSMAVTQNATSQIWTKCYAINSKCHISAVRKKNMDRLYMYIVYILLYL